MTASTPQDTEPDDHAVRLEPDDPDPRAERSRAEERDDEDEGWVPA